MSDLFVAVVQHPAALAAVCTGGVLLLQVVIGVACDHETELRAARARAGRALADFVVWVLDAVPAAAGAVARAAHAVLLWLLAHVLRAHGHHRSGVA